MCNRNISTVPLCDICAEQTQHSSTLDVCCMRAVSIDASQLCAASMHITSCSMLVLYAVCTHTQIVACSTYSAYVQDMVQMSATCKPDVSR